MKPFFLQWAKNISQYTIPAVDDSNVYVIADSLITAFDKWDGSEKWQHTHIGHPSLAVAAVRGGGLPYHGGNALWHAGSGLQPGQRNGAGRESPVRRPACPPHQADNGHLVRRRRVRNSLVAPQVDHLMLLLSR